jgi:uncharacterized protein
MIKEYAIITGASSGIGLEFANQLAEKKNNIILISRRKNELEKISKELNNKYGVNCIVYPCDLSKEQEIEKLSKYISNLKEVSYLINCAGFGYSSYFNKMNPRIVKEEINVHVLATTLLTRAALPGMIKRNKGNIINVSSIASFITTSKSNAIYNSTKAYIRIFTETLIDEMDANNFNIHVQALCPGFTKTNFFKHYKASFVPRIFWMRTDRVVRRSLKKIDCGSSVYIAGFKNKMIVWLLKWWIINKMFNSAARKLNIE